MASGFGTGMNMGLFDAQKITWHDDIPPSAHASWFNAKDWTITVDIAYARLTCPDSWRRQVVAAFAHELIHAAQFVWYWVICRNAPAWNDDAREVLANRVQDAILHMTGVRW